MKKSFGPKTLVFATPVWVIGTYDKEGRPNAATVAWGGVCSSKPAAVAISLRKSRYTYENLVERRAFTVNVPSAEQVKIADYCGITSGRKEDKFARSGITAVKSELVDAPYIKEFPMVLECKLMQTIEAGIHTHFIGEILDVKVDENMLNAEGLPDIYKINPFIYGPEIQGYYGLGAYLGRAFSVGKDI
ncbi:MAG TPA: flavin reductase family protein [Smithellaceae bacterium]|nr:flavin reductase family protein [Smithellaceae bacterium]HRS88958.1 flavin reductase family protein [Smithellaceae bacterium]HRV25574.1 flavin reductase family protein [Smithellaceae bacterium]